MFTGSSYFKKGKIFTKLEAWVVLDTKKNLDCQKMLNTRHEEFLLEISLFFFNFGPETP